MNGNILVVAMAFGMFVVVLATAPTKLVLAMGNAGSDRCAWERLKCPELSEEDDLEACVEDGDGNPCKCGKKTRDCK